MTRRELALRRRARAIRAMSPAERDAMHRRQTARELVIVRRTPARTLIERARKHAVGDFPSFILPDGMYVNYGLEHHDLTDEIYGREYTPGMWDFIDRVGAVRASMNNAGAVMLETSHPLTEAQARAWIDLARRPETRSLWVDVTRFDPIWASETRASQRFPAGHERAALGFIRRALADERENPLRRNPITRSSALLTVRFRTRRDAYDFTVDVSRLAPWASAAQQGTDVRVGLRAECETWPDPDQNYADDWEVTHAVLTVAEDGGLYVDVCVEPDGGTSRSSSAYQDWIDVRVDAASDVSGVAPLILPVLIEPPRVMTWPAWRGGPMTTGRALPVTDGQGFRYFIDPPVRVEP